MWSNKGIVNCIVNILLFLLGMNFMHYGQAFLPIICLILFIDNKCKLNIVNKKIFIILCLFGVSFFIFTYKMGFYCVVGLCLPMAYYIGSNIRKRNEENILNIIYLLAFGMATHVIMNFIYELALLGPSVVSKIHHFDIWTGEHISTTGTAINYTFIIALIYYIIFKERNTKVRKMGVAIFILLIAYNIALGRRTPIFMLIVSLLLSYILDIFIYKNRTINKRIAVFVFVVFVVVVLLAVLIYICNAFDIRNKFIYINILCKFYVFGLDPERFELFIKGLMLAPSHLWGGQEISTIIGTQIHDLWMDTYDYAGIIPFVLLAIYSFIVIKETVYITKNKINNKPLFVVFFVCILIQLLLEPIITGSSIFLICVILVLSSYQTIKNNYE